MDIAIAIIRHAGTGEILITRRRDGAHLGGLWEFPGGKCEPGEPLWDCARRETREETGLVVEWRETWPPITHAYPERTVTLHPFLCVTKHGEACPLQSTEARWVLPSALHEYPFPEANAPLLARLAGDGHSSASHST